MGKTVEKQKEILVSSSCGPIILPDYDAKISEIAYYKAERRNFEPGYEVTDWLEAEQEYMECIK